MIWARIAAAALEIWNTWLGGYSRKEAIKAREINDNQKKVDEFIKAEKDGNLDEVRKCVADRPPIQ